MSYNSFDTPMPETNNGEVIRGRFSNKVLKSIPVIDQIKTKVKRKKLPNGISTDNIPRLTTSENLINQVPYEIDSKTPLKAAHSQEVLNHSPTSYNVSYRNQNPQSNLFNEQNDTKSKMSLDFMEKTDVNTENIQTRFDSHELKRSFTSLPEVVDRTSKKNNRRPKNSPKLHWNKKGKENQYTSMGILHYLAGFQIRDKDFNTIFKSLPPDEKLIIAYPCVWRKDIPMHGRVFLSVNYICFYACFSKREEIPSIPYKYITSIKKERSTKEVENAIKIQTNNGEKYLFASYVPRKQIYNVLYHLWQNCFLDQPLDYQQLQANINIDQMSSEDSTDESEESINNENNDQNIPDIIVESPTGAKLFNFEKESQQMNYMSKCPCETHLGRIFVDRKFSFPVDKLFDLYFGNNSFTRALHDSQKLIDYTTGEWHTNNDTNKRERQVRYKTISQSILGTNTITSTEKQTIEIDKPHLVYVVNSEVFNEGIKYTDAFFVATRTCLFQCDAKNSSLCISGEIKYIKTVNAIARSFIEKNTNASIENGVNDLVRKLEDNQLTSHRKFNKSKLPKREPPKTNEIGTKIDNSSNSTKSQSFISTKILFGKDFFYNFVLFIGILLIILHIYLCYKLSSIDQTLYNRNNKCVEQCKKICLENKFRQ